MKITGTKLFSMAVGLTVGNYMYAWFAEQPGTAAFEHSYFQVGTILAVWAMLRLEGALSRQ